MKPTCFAERTKVDEENSSGIEKVFLLKEKRRDKTSYK